MKPKRPETIEHGGRDWVEIKIAAKFARLQAILIEQMGRDSQFDLLELNGGTYIPLSAASRLKRETQTLRSIDRLSRKEREIGKSVGHRGFRSSAPISPGIQVQDVLPMSSGREGQGWLGLPRRK